VGDQEDLHTLYSMVREALGDTVHLRQQIGEERERRGQELAAARHQLKRLEKQQHKVQTLLQEAVAPGVSLKLSVPLPEPAVPRGRRPPAGSEGETDAEEVLAPAAAPAFASLDHPDVWAVGKSSTSSSGAAFSVHQGYLPPGSELFAALMSLDEAKEACPWLPGCCGFTFEGSPRMGLIYVFFKHAWQLNGMGGPSWGWTSYRLESEHQVEHWLGTWVYGDEPCEYRIGKTGAGELYFEYGQAPGLASGPLLMYGQWIQAELWGSDGQQAGAVRLQYLTEEDCIVLGFRSPEGGLWGEDLVSRRRGSASAAGVEAAPPPAA